MARPFDVFDPSGTSKMRIQKHLPLAVKINSQLWLVAVKMCSTFCYYGRLVLETLPISNYDENCGRKECEWHPQHEAHQDKLDIHSSGIHQLIELSESMILLLVSQRR